MIAAAFALFRRLLHLNFLGRTIWESPNRVHTNARDVICCEWHADIAPVWPHTEPKVPIIPRVRDVCRDLSEHSTLSTELGTDACLSVRI